MSTYPAPRKSLTVFNPADYQLAFHKDTIEYGDDRYLIKQKGGKVSGATEFKKGVKIGALPYEDTYEERTHNFRFETEQVNGEDADVMMEVLSKEGASTLRLSQENHKLKVGLTSVVDGGHAEIMHSTNRQVRIGNDNTTKILVNELGYDESTDVEITSLGVGQGVKTDLSYRLGSGASFSSTQSRFGTKSLFLPRTVTTGLTVDGILTSTDFSNAWTIEFWIYPLSWEATSYIVSTQNAELTTGMHLFMDTSRRLTFSVDSGGFERAAHTWFGTLTGSTWNHVAFGHTGGVTGTYFGAVNGSFSLDNTPINPANINYAGMGSLVHFGSMYLNTNSSEYPRFESPFHGYIDEVRFSKTARYSASFTPSTSAFNSDSNTFFLHHCESLVASQETPTTTTSNGVEASASGGLDVVGDLTSEAGSITMESGNITATRGYLGAYRDLMFSQPTWRIGPSGVLNSTAAISNIVTVGCYSVSSDWSTADATTHTINLAHLFHHVNNTNAMASLMIFVSDKVSNGLAGTAKLGLLKGDLLRTASTYTWLPISTSKTTTLSTFSATASSSALTVTTDSSCRMCWRGDVCI